MDKAVASTVQKIMGQGEQKAPVKSIKLKVKFRDQGRKAADRKTSR